MFMGRPGAGKGTQSRLLIESLNKIDPAHPVLHIETGAEFRKFNEGSSYTAKVGKRVVDSGGLMPEFMPVYIWGSALVAGFTGDQHVIFDGTPRKLLEGELVGSVFPFYGLRPHLVYLEVDHEESKKRLLLRSQREGRKDDDEAAIERRKTAYETDVHPTVEYFRSAEGVDFHEIDGLGAIEAVHQRILEALKLS